jgi:hypothetical protein
VATRRVSGYVATASFACSTDSQRGWSPEAYERWLAETLSAQLIKDRDAGARRPRSRARNRRTGNE